MTVAEFSRRTGKSEGAIRNNVYQGRWLEGREFVRKRRDPTKRGQIMIDHPKALDWYARET